MLKVRTEVNAEGQGAEVSTKVRVAITKEVELKSKAMKIGS